MAFDFAVAAVDHEMMFFAEISHELGDVDAAVVFHTGERDRAKIFFGEKIRIRAALTQSWINALVRDVTVKTRSTTFGEEFIELGLQGEDVSDARRARGHALGSAVF